MTSPLALFPSTKVTDLSELVVYLRLSYTKSSAKENTDADNATHRISNRFNLMVLILIGFLNRPIRLLSCLMVK